MTDTLVRTITLIYRGGHPITYNHYFTDTVRKMQAERREKELLEKFETYDKCNCQLAVSMIMLSNYTTIVLQLVEMTEPEMD